MIFLECGEPSPLLAFEFWSAASHRRFLVFSFVFSAPQQEIQKSQSKKPKAAMARRTPNQTSGCTQGLR